MNKFATLLRKYQEAIAAGMDPAEAEAQVLQRVKATGRGEFNSIEELERAGMEGIERDLDASETRLGNLARGAAQGLTIGLSDELAGVARGLNPFDDIKGFGAGYESGKEEATAKLERGRRENPIASFMGEMAGAVVPGAGAMRAASMIPRVGRALRSPKLLPRVTRSGLEPGRLASTAALGAVEGGAYGFGAGEGGVEGRMESAETGAKFGGVVGGALPVLPLVGGLLRRQGARGGTIQETLQEGIEGVRPRRVDLGTLPRTERGPRGLLDSAETQLEPVRNRRINTTVKLEKNVEDASSKFDDVFKKYEGNIDDKGKYIGWESTSGGPDATKKLAKYFEDNKLIFGSRDSLDINVRDALEEIEGIVAQGDQQNLPLKAMEIVRRHLRDRARDGGKRVNVAFDELDNLLDEAFPDIKPVRRKYSEANMMNEAYSAGSGTGVKQIGKGTGESGLFSDTNVFNKQNLKRAMRKLTDDPRIRSLPKAQQGARKAAVERQFLDGVWDRFSTSLEGGTDKEGTTSRYKLTRGEGKEWFREFFEEGPKGDRAFRQAMNIVEDITPFRARHKLLYNFMRMAAIFGAARAAFASGESGLLGTIDPF